MKMGRYDNTRKKKALKRLDIVSLEDDDNDLTRRSKYNFSYFDHSQAAGQDFSQLSEKQLHDLINSLKEFGKFPLHHWELEKRLVIYGKFPTVTEFVHPRHVPHQACWGRFRLGNKTRLVGFIIPPQLHGKAHPKTRELYDKNTFYIVFIDKNHLFWKTEKR